MHLSFAGALLLCAWCLAYAVDAEVELKLNAAVSPIVYASGQLSTADIHVLVIASEKREDWKLQADTWLQHFPHYIATEKHTPKCKLCGTTNATPYKGALFEGALHFGDRFHNRPLDWYCAQQRPMQALARVLAQAQARASLPKWLVIIDDDTALHPWNALKMLTSKPADLNAKQVFGSELKGGAGFILSQGAMKNLTGPIMVNDMVWDRRSLRWTQQTDTTTTVMDACLERLLGGKWCYMHSDHAMGRCAVSAGIQMIDRGKVMEQNCPVGTKVMVPYTDKHVENKIRTVEAADAKTQAWIRNDMVSCHHMDKTSMDSIYAAIKGSWAASSSSKAGSAGSGGAGKAAPADSDS